MHTIGDKLPKFNLKAVKAGKYPKSPNEAFIDISNETYKGKWQVIFFYPKDFTFVCPTEIKAFADLNSVIDGLTHLVFSCIVDFISPYYLFINIYSEMIFFHPFI